jgi:branched-chain amino acid aminotransferase
MDDRDGFIWYDGRLVPWRTATTHVLCHSLHYGVAVFEGLRAYRTPRGTAIFRLAEHTARLFGSAHIYRMRIPFARTEIMDAQREVVRANGLEAAYVRPIAFYGPEKMGIHPAGARVHVAIAAWSWGAYLGPLAQAEGIRVKTSSFARHHVNVTMPRAKLSATYANSVLASVEAHDDGYDEALLLDVDGFVAEGPGENLFVVKDGHLYEPELASALTGITRDSVIALARERGYPYSARRLTRDDVYLADEAFFCGTAAEVTPIVELDRRPIGSGAPGPWTRTLAGALLDAACGNDPKHLDWITPVCPTRSSDFSETTPAA